MRYFIDDEYNLFTLEDIRNLYEELKRDGDIDEYMTGTFEQYLSACMYYNNGMLTEISENDARQIIVRDENGKQYKDFIYWLKTYENADCICWNKINVVTVNEDYHIILSGGY